jgi:hypothetical protein
MFLRKEAIKKLSTELALPCEGNEQDWDIEMADPNRIDDFLKYFRTQSLLADEKFALMALIMASYEDFLNEQDVDVDRRWKAIRQILQVEAALYSSLVSYWALSGESRSEDLFRITLLVREIDNGQ